MTIAALNGQNHVYRDAVALSYRSLIADMKMQLEYLEYQVSFSWRDPPNHPGYDTPIRIENIAGLYRAVLLLWKYDSAARSKRFLLALGDMRGIHRQLRWYGCSLEGSSVLAKAKESWNEDDCERERLFLTDKWLYGLSMLLRFIRPKAYGIFRG